MANGVSTNNIDPVAISDEVLVNRDGSTGRQKTVDLATQLAGSGAIAQRLAPLETRTTDLETSTVDQETRLAGLENGTYAEAIPFATTAAGIADTAQGQRFKVDNVDPDVAYDVYLHDAGGVAVFVESQPSVTALTIKANKESVDEQDGDVLEVLGQLLETQFISGNTTPVTGTHNATASTYLLDGDIADGILNSLEFFGGDAGTIKLRIFENTSGTIWEQVGVDHPFDILAGVNNVFHPFIKVSAGQRVGLYVPDYVVCFQSTGGGSYRNVSDATMFDTSVDARNGAKLEVKISIKSSSYDKDSVDTAVAVGNIISGSPDNFSGGARLPILFDRGGKYGDKYTVYLPARLWVTLLGDASWTDISVTNTIVETMAGAYCAMPLTTNAAAGVWISQIIYLDLSDNTIKLASGSTMPTHPAKHLALFQIVGPDAWRSPAGIHVKVLDGLFGNEILADVYDAAINPLRDLNAVFIGDSITWGMTASGISITEPRGHSLSDVRDDFTSKSWANLTRSWLSNLGAGQSTLSVVEAGKSLASQTVQVAPWKDLRSFKVLMANRYEGQAASGTHANAKLKTYLNSTQSPDTAIMFDYVGGDISIFHAIFDEQVLEFYIDGVLNTTYTAPEDTVAAFKHETALTVPFGRHTVEVRSVAGLLRVEAIERTKEVSVFNQGLIGTNSTEWLPDGSLLPAAIPAETTHLFIQLGTNDRTREAGSDYPAYAAATYQCLSDAVEWVQTNYPDLLVVMMAPPHYAWGGTGSAASELAQSIKRVADIYGCGFIDNCSPTYELEMVGETWLADGLHPNDFGHRVIFQNIQQTIMRAS